MVRGILDGEGIKTNCLQPYPVPPPLFRLITLRFHPRLSFSLTRYDHYKEDIIATRWQSCGQRPFFPEILLF